MWSAAVSNGTQPPRRNSELIAQVTKPAVNSAVLPIGRLPLSKTPERVTLPSDPRESRNVGFSMLVA